MEWNWQTVVSLMIVAGAATALVGAKLRRRKFNFRRDTHCGCAGPGAAEPPPRIIFHARKGERPKVLVKNP
jgi:hypothetical protein